MPLTVPLPDAVDEKLVRLVTHMSLGRYLVLKALNESDKTMTPLAQVAKVSTAGMTCIKDAMKADGLLTDYRDENDRRNVYVQITAYGKKAIALFAAMA
jgi:DNA-binding MarR family transcriptional regulator